MESNEMTREERDEDSKGIPTWWMLAVMVLAFLITDPVGHYVIDTLHWVQMPPVHGDVLGLHIQRCVVGSMVIVVPGGLFALWENRN